MRLASKPPPTRWQVKSEQGLDGIKDEPPKDNGQCSGQNRRLNQVHNKLPRNAFHATTRRPPAGSTKEKSPAAEKL